MKKIAPVLIMSAALAACQTFRDYTEPVNPAGTEQTNLSAENAAFFKSAQAPVAAWWNEFDDPQLGELVEKSLDTNLDVRIALANLFEARSISRKTGFDRFPTVTSGASFDRQLNSQETPAGQFNERVQNNYEAGFDAVWELDLFGRVSERIAAQEALEDSALADLQDIYVTVTAEVARTYIELRGAQYRLDIAERNAANQHETYDLTRRLSLGGRGTALDTSRAKTQLDLTRSSIPPLKAEVTAAINRLSVLTGQVPDALRGELSGKKPLPSLPVSVAVGDASSLLKRRPDIRSAERELAASVAQYNVAATDLFPTVNIVGSLGFIATNLGSFGATALAGTLGPSLNWRAFDLGRVRAEVNQADARSEAALARYERTVLRALEETQTALSDFTSEEERRATLQDAARSSQQAALIARQRYDLGADGFLDVLDAERTQLQAEDALAGSEISAALDLITIYKALGGGWQVKSNNTRGKNNDTSGYAARKGTA